VNKYVAELVGTFVLVFGAWAAQSWPGATLIEGVAFAFGLSLLAMVYTIGPFGCTSIRGDLRSFPGEENRREDAVAYVIFQIVARSLPPPSFCSSPKETRRI